MSRQRISTLRIVAPSQRARTTLSLAGPYAITLSPGIAASALSAGSTPAAVESGTPCARAEVDPVHAESARATVIALALRKGASPGRVSEFDADTVTRELGLSALGESLHQVLERLLGLGLPAQALLAQSDLVERRRRAVAVRPLRSDLVVLDERAVEPGLGEEALAGPVLGIIGQVGVRVAAQVSAIARERHGVSPLREVRRGLVVELRRVAGRGRRLRCPGGAVRRC